MEIGIKIKRLREQKRLSQMELSTVLGISQTKLCHIESNVDKSIDFILMNKICHFFEVGFDYFLAQNNFSDIQKKNEMPIEPGLEWYNNFPESIIGQINSLILDNKFKEQKINELLAQIAQLESKK